MTASAEVEEAWGSINYLHRLRPSSRDLSLVSSRKTLSIGPD